MSLVTAIVGEFGTDKWFRRNQIWLLGGLNNPIPKVRDYFRENIVCVPFDDKIKIARITPNSVHYQVNKDIRAGNFYSLDCNSNHIRKNFERFLMPLHTFDMKFANPFVPILNLGYDNITANSTTKDGYVYNTNAVWATSRNAATGTYKSDNNTGGEYIKAMVSNYAIYRCFFYFDTTSMGSGKTISLATFSIYGYDTRYATSVAILEGTQGASLATSDFDSFSTYFGYNPTWNNTGYTDFSLNASGITYVNNYNNARICARQYSCDYLDSAPTGSSERCLLYMAEAGAGKYPKLYIEYSSPSTGLPPFPFMRF